MPLNFDLAPKTYDPVQVEVDAGAIEAYADASGDPNPSYRAGPDQIASPVFSVVPAFSLMARVALDPDLGLSNPLMTVHGEQRFAYHEPLRPGSSLVMAPSMESVEDKGRGATFVTKIAITASDGSGVLDAYSTVFVRDGGSGVDRPRSEQDPEPEREAPVAAFTSHVDAAMPAEYAAASGDHNPIHLDDSVAKAVGLPGVINHGLGTLSLVVGGLVEATAGGDSTRLQTLQVRFTGMVFPGSDLTTTVWGAGDDLEFETARSGGAVAMKGRLRVRGG